MQVWCSHGSQNHKDLLHGPTLLGWGDDLFWNVEITPRIIFFFPQSLLLDGHEEDSSEDLLARRRREDELLATRLASHEQYGLSSGTSPASIAAAVGRLFRLLRLTPPLLLSSSMSITGDGSRFTCLLYSGSSSSVTGVGFRRTRFFCCFGCCCCCCCFRLETDVDAAAEELLSAAKGFLLCVRKVFVVSPLAFFLSNK